MNDSQKERLNEVIEDFERFSLSVINIEDIDTKLAILGIITDWAWERTKKTLELKAELERIGITTDLDPKAGVLRSFKEVLNDILLSKKMV